MPRPRKISRQNVLDAAYLQVAREGISSLSMRALGKDLGVEAMSLYKYVGRREDLVALLRAELFASIRLPAPAKSPRRDLEAVCTTLFRGLVSAPGGASLAPPLPGLTSPGLSAVSSKATPRDLDESPESGVAERSGAAGNAALAPTPVKDRPWLPIVERVLSALRALIPEPLDRAYAAHTLLSFVLGQVVFGGTSGALLGEHLDGAVPLSAEFPEVRAILGALQSRSSEVEFELGLRALLDAMEARRGF
jgi:AcrR family transcriptional regulator